MSTIILVESFSQYMTRKFREWEATKNGRQSVSAFARYLGVKQPTLTRWMQGDTVPDLANVQVLSGFFGNEVYDILGMPRPNDEKSPSFAEWMRMYMNANEEERKAMDEWLEQRKEERARQRGAKQI